MFTALLFRLLGPKGLGFRGVKLGLRVSWHKGLG